MFNDAATDRFIPSRIAHIESVSADKLGDNSTNYSKIISPEKFRCLKFNVKSAEKSETVSEFIHKSMRKKKPPIIKQSIKAYRILDAPDIVDNYYYDPLDWGSNKNVGIALDRSAFILKEGGQICEIDRSSSIQICSLKLISKGELCILGEETGRVEVYDISKNRRLRTINCHFNRIGCLCQKETGMFFSGSKDKLIKYNDLRLKKADVLTFERHRGEVCGLSVNNYLASGGNQNKICVWDLRSCRPIVELKQHCSAVKALSWCPWKSNILASGGGYKDGKIILWNGSTQKIQNTLNIKSQITSIIWNQQYRYLMSSASNGQSSKCLIWETGHLKLKYKLKGHQGRIIGMAMSQQSKDQICTIGADETLRFWHIPKDDENGDEPGSKESAGLIPSSDFR